MAVLVSRPFAAGVENHVTWFSSTVTWNNTDGNTAVGCLQWAQTAQFSGVQLDNYPYFTVITAGNQYRHSLWYKELTATMPTAQWQITYLDATTTAIAGAPHVVLNMPRSTVWTQVTADLVAPAGAVGLKWEFQTTTGTTSTMLIDDIIIEDVPAVQSESSRHQHVDMFAMARRRR